MMPQVVYTLVSAADDEYALPGDRADASVWRRVFLQTGGMRRLLSLLQEGGGMDPSRVRRKSMLPPCSETCAEVLGHRVLTPSCRGTPAECLLRFLIHG